MALKNDLVNAINSKVDYLSKQDVEYAVDFILNYLQSELANRNRIEIRGFGCFSVRSRKASNSDKIYNTIYYRSAKGLLEKVNSK